MAHSGFLVLELEWVYSRERKRERIIIWHLLSSRYLRLKCQHLSACLARSRRKEGKKKKQKTAKQILLGIMGEPRVSSRLDVKTLQKHHLCLSLTCKIQPKLFSLFVAPERVSRNPQSSRFSLSEEMWSHSNWTCRFLKTSSHNSTITWVHRGRFGEGLMKLLHGSFCRGEDLKRKQSVPAVTISHVAPLSHLAESNAWFPDWRGGFKGMTYYTEKSCGLSPACRASKAKNLHRDDYAHGTERERGKKQTEWRRTKTGHTNKLTLPYHGVTALKMCQGWISSTSQRKHRRRLYSAASVQTKGRVHLSLRSLFCLRFCQNLIVVAHWWKVLNVVVSGSRGLCFFLLQHTQKQGNRENNEAFILKKYCLPLSPASYALCYYDYKKFDDWCLLSWGSSATFPHEFAFTLNRIRLKATTRLINKKLLDLAALQ